MTPAQGSLAVHIAFFAGVLGTLLSDRGSPWAYAAIVVLVVLQFIVARALKRPRFIVIERK